jgi:hypothetical protein
MARSARTVVRSTVPLGSLTQPGARSGTGCRACGSPRVTQIAMSLTDGSPVEFVSCHNCEHRTWSEEGARAGRRARPRQGAQARLKPAGRRTAGTRARS